MTRNHAIGLIAASITLAVSVAAPAVAHASGNATDPLVPVGAEGAVMVRADSALAQVAMSGCGGSRSNTTVPSTIRVLRGSGKVDVVPFRSYVENVLPNEWVSSWSPASLRAGAIAVKSFAWFWVNHSAYRISPGGQCYDVTDDTRSQVYRPGSATAVTNAAVEATWGTRLTRGGAVLKAHYCSTSTACGAWVDGDWMSQHGSQDLARRGVGHAEILRHYYRGVVVSGVSAKRKSKPEPAPKPKHRSKDSGEQHRKPGEQHRKPGEQPPHKAKPGKKSRSRGWTITVTCRPGTSAEVAGLLDGVRDLSCRAGVKEPATGSGPADD